MKKYLLSFLCLVMIGCATESVLLSPVPPGSRLSNETLDFRGKTITTYIAYNAEKKLSGMSEGEILELITSNYQAIESDLSAWTRQRGYPLLEVEKKPEYERYYIKKVKPKTNPKKVAVVVSEDGLETSLSPLAFSLAAALEGAEVHIYIQGPAVKMFESGFEAKLSGFSRPFSYFARKQLADMGHSPPQEKLRQMYDLGVHLYLCAPSVDYFGVDKNKLIFNDIPVIEYLSFMEIASESDVQFYP